MLNYQWVYVNIQNPISEWWWLVGWWPGWIPMACSPQRLPWNDPQSDRYPGKWHKCVDLVGWCIYIYIIYMYTIIYVHIHIEDICMYIYILYHYISHHEMAKNKVLVIRGPLDRPPPRACSVAPASVAQLRFGLPRPDTRPGSTRNAWILCVYI
jgi:hypothetical protein